MKPFDQLLTAIASEHLGISTLTTRNSDSLDFHDVAVWQVQTALTAAFDAGAEAACPPAERATDLPTRFDAYEIWPCRRYLDSNDPDQAFVETCASYEADFWTVYGHVRGEGIHAIGDFATRGHAEEVFARITGRSYAGDL